MSKITNDVSGIKAEKIVDPDNPDNVSLKLTSTDSSKYLSVTQESGFDVVSDLNIAMDKEKAASGAVTASAFSPNSGKFQFSLSSKQTGVDFRITNLSDAGSSSALDALGLNIGNSRPAFDQSTTPDTAGYVYSDISENSLLNSKFIFNGLNIQRNSNVVNDLVSGVTFTLNSVMQETDPDINVSVKSDTSSVRSNVEDFISKFNDVFSYIKSQNTFGSGKRGVFAGDSNASSLTNILSSVIYSPVSGIPSGDINMLAQLGITFSSTNGLSISDSTKLDNQINNNPSQVEALFNSSNGIANKLFDQIKPYLGSGGYLALGQSRFDTTVNSLNDKNSAMQKRIDKNAESLRNRYEQLQAQLASLLSIQSMFGA